MHVHLPTAKNVAIAGENEDESEKSAKPYWEMTTGMILVTEKDGKGVGSVGSR